MGGKHSGQAGMPQTRAEQLIGEGIVRDETGQEQKIRPADKPRAQHVSRRKIQGGDPPGAPQPASRPRQ